MSIRITELDAITSLQSGDYIAVDNESTGTHKFDALNIGANIGQNIANTYSSSASYAIGQYCLYDNNLYKCITTISTPEAWNSSHWIQVTVGEGLYEKVDKISGKGLSTNDFTDEYKQKLGGIEAGAEVNVQANWAETNTLSDDYIKNKPENATTSTSGFMSASDKQKLDNIEAGAEVNVQANWAENDSSKDDYIKNKPTIDTALSTSSDNAVRNSAITAGINTVQNNLNAEQTARENADNALDGRIDIIEETLPNKANINGFYEEMTVGSAEQLISTESIEDSELYIFRKSGNGADIGDRETDMLVGGTVAWNQLVSDNTMHRTSTSASNWDTITSNFSVINGHKYLAMLNGVTVAGGQIGVRDSTEGITYRPNMGYSLVYSATTTSNNTTVIQGSWDAGTTDAYINVFDLTQMFGSTIADYIYSLEQANVGDGVAWFKKYFPKSYYTYDAGSLQSVNVASHDMTGFNQLEEQPVIGARWNTNGTYSPSGNNNYAASPSKVKCFPNTSYCISFPNTFVNLYAYFIWFDADGNFIGGSSAATVSSTQKKITFTTSSDAYYLALYIYRNNWSSASDIKDTCINLSWDGERNGEYEEYVIHSYPYDELVELRGIPQLVDGELKYDGDTYESSGKVMRKYGIVDLGSLTWNYNSTNGYFYANVDNGVPNLGIYKMPNILCDIYKTVASMYGADFPNAENGIVTWSRDSSQVQIKNTAYTDATTFKTAMNGVQLCYELVTPVEEEAEGFTNPQIVDASGTEEYVDAGVKNNTRDMAIPVGHITQYVVNLRDKLQHLPFLAKEDGDYFVNQTGAQMKLKKVEGYYEDLVVGVADNLSTDIRTNDQTPYLFRTSGGSVDIGDREYINSVVGGTIAWNQLTESPNFADSTKWTVKNNRTTLFIDNNVATVTYISGNGGWDTPAIAPSTEPPAIAGHKYLFSFEASTTSSKTNFIVRSNTFGNTEFVGASSTMTKFSKILSASTNDNTYGYIGLSGNGSYEIGDTISFKSIQIFDLTQMFGTTIADYIYSLEQTNAGAGVAFFRKLFPKPYYAYNAGELLSVSGLASHDMTGFNQWDEEWELGGISNTTGNNQTNTTQIRSKNYISILPNTTYYFRCDSRMNTYNVQSRFYDADKNYIGTGDTVWYCNDTVTTPANARYFRFAMQTQYGTTYNHDICINLAWDNSRNGEYEPYQKWSYPLDSSLVLRGVPKLDSNNNLYYDGDEYAPDGTVTRKYGIVDLGTLTWTKTSIGSTESYKFTSSTISNIKTWDAWYHTINMICPNYTTGTINSQPQSNKEITQNKNATTVQIWDESLSSGDATAFKTAMSGVYLVYELATPTTETAEPYTNPQIVDDFGTEEYVIDSTIDVPIPVGHNTDYPINLKSKLEMAPDSPDGDGDYIVRQTNGTNEYVPLIIEDQLPAVPSTDGTYTLTVTIANGEATYSWT